MEEEKEIQEKEVPENEKDFWKDMENPWVKITDQPQEDKPEEDKPKDEEPGDDESGEIKDDKAEETKDEEPEKPTKKAEPPLVKEKVKDTEVISKALKAEKKIKSSWYILDLKGKMHKLDLKNNRISGFNFSEHQNLKKFALYEMAKSRDTKEQPVHVNLMRKLEIADYEPASDPGNLRYYPNGTLVRDLIVDLVDSYIFQYDAMKVETPIMYDLEHPTLKKYLDRFPARQYLVESMKKNYFLRFAACFGQFLIAKDAIISYRNLPMKMYELAKYSFRLEQRGELAGLRRLRAFVMPDCHCLCKDIDQSKEEMMTRFELAKALQKDIGFDFPDEFELGLRVVRGFYEENKEFVHKLVQSYGKPALMEMWEEQFAYFIFKYEFNYVDSTEKAGALSTDQIDIENAKNYNILYTDSDNKRKHPIILHQSPSGGICRVMMALLERTRGKQNPMLPVWLSPEQVRLLPINDDHLDFVESLARKMESKCIRVGIDDRQMSVGKKVFEAKSDWIPYIIVVGDREIKSKKLPVVVREHSEKKDKIEKMTEEQLLDTLQKNTEGKPFRPMYIPRYLSSRPLFLAWSESKEPEKKKPKEEPEKPIKEELKPVKEKKTKKKEQKREKKPKPKAKKPAKKKKTERKTKKPEKKKKIMKKKAKPKKKTAKSKKKKTKPRKRGEKSESSTVALHKLQV